jgi:hypothetical protein
MQAAPGGVFLSIASYSRGEPRNPAPGRSQSLIEGPCSGSLLDGAASLRPAVHSWGAATVRGPLRGREPGRSHVLALRLAVGMSGLSDPLLIGSVMAIDRWVDN